MFLDQLGLILGSSKLIEQKYQNIPQLYLRPFALCMVGLQRISRDNCTKRTLRLFSSIIQEHWYYCFSFDFTYCFANVDAMDVWSSKMAIAVKAAHSFAYFQGNDDDFYWHLILDCNSQQVWWIPWQNFTLAQRTATTSNGLYIYWQFCSANYNLFRGKLGTTANCF